MYSIRKDGSLNDEEKGRAFEVVVGMALNRLPGELFYWREGSHEVDYVYCFQKKIYAIEVKSKFHKTQKSLYQFKKKFPAGNTLILTPDNYEKLIKKL